MQPKITRYQLVINTAADIGSEDGPCLLWPYANNERGYGVLSKSINGRLTMIKVHRLAFEAYSGPIPEGMEVCHACDNPACYRVAHLFVGTHKQNIHDCIEKGRNSQPPRRIGQDHPNAKLTEAKVREMLRLKREGLSIPKIAAAHNVNRTTVKRILAGKSWSHVSH
jgi:hypothetical protein